MDNTRRPISEYEKCSWARVPSHAVMCVNDEAKAKAITDFLLQAQSKSDCKLFDSSHGKDLMFKDSAKSLIPIPFKVDAAMYLGKELTDAIKAISTGVEEPPKDKIRWCTQSKEEKSKCDTWTIASEGAIECVEASLAEECITKILKGDADAVTLDGGYLYTAGVCGLIPAMAEIYDADKCKGTGTAAGSYYAVAVVKASDKTISWNNLKDKKSCHTGVERTAGWVIPAGHIKKEHGICDLSTYFKESCAPGANVTSSLCKLCAGDQKSLEDTKCSANNKELYYGYHGAIRCLVEKGDVAFVKDATIFEAIKDAPDWLKNKKLDDYRLLCRDGSIRPVTEYKDCHLALVPSHVVATTPTRRDVVVRILKEQQRLYGRKDDKSFQFFNMFDSAGLRDLLFKSTTQCLREVTVSNMNDYLGQEYLDAVSSLSSCAQSELLKACTFHTCKPSLKV
ncbi:hypothetical protein GDO81_007278 [Engystomops pustulosus]|uniref:Transferrin-like domain-containing protein n=1 Tax=Engystomops pustulosus TaxID=76066 RepID=A0AAV7C5Y9_ENGPU|nr:hypothetical protein GDO81_007278 [Engystomops pustulosus]